MMKGRTIFAAAALAAVVVTSGVAYAAVTSMHSTSDTAASPSHAAVDLSDFTANPASSVFLEADLNGRGEMTQTNQQMGDPMGQALVVLRITRNRILYEINWQSMTPPSSIRLQLGAAGENGPVQMNLMPNAMPGTITAIAGVINLNGNGLLNQLLGNPGRFNANFTTPAFPGGAVRGQFRPIATFDFMRILHVGQVLAVGSGDQEVAGARVGNDPNMRSTVLAGTGANATTLNYAAIWSGLNSPTALNLNVGAVGMNGNLIATLFRADRGLNPTIIAVAGWVPNVPAQVIAAMKANPAAVHSQLSTGRFPGGAARGQFFALGATPTTTTPPKPPTTTPVKPTTPMNPPPTTMPTMPSVPVPGGPPPVTGTQAPPHW
jgi:hypothetical protein